jgi:uncharacterized delta-60 repeat protein
MQKIFTLAACLYISIQLWGQAGTLNTQFNNGVATTSFGPDHCGADDIAVQPDGKVVVAGYAMVGGVSNFAVARYHVNGILDASFGTGGKLTLNPAAAGGCWLKAITVQNDGKIVVGGSFSNGTTVSFALMRLQSNGNVDASFGTNGLVTTAVGNYAHIKDIALQPDGKIIAAGESTTGVFYDFTVIRYTSTGAIDYTFGAGVNTFNISGDDYVKSVKYQPDGKVLIAGSADYMFAMARLSPNGSLDGEFGTEGKVITVVGITLGNDNCTGIALQNDGKIIAVGEGFFGAMASNIVVARYSVHGTLDNSFGTNGVKSLDIGGSFDQASCVMVQSDGKIVVGGNTVVGGQPSVVVARFLLGGMLDPGFGTGGYTVTAIGSEAYVYAMAFYGTSIYFSGVEKATPDVFALTSYINDVSPLPVRYADFSVQKNNSTVTLQWQTENEWNTKSFVAEKSDDGKKFIPFKEVAAAGTSSVLTQYRTFDEQPYNNITYYRIKSVDHDGFTSFTKILTVKNDIKNIEVFPNPVQSYVQIQLPGGIKGDVKINVTDLAGKTVRTKDVQLQGSSLSVSLQMNEFAKGMYLVNVSSDNLNFSQRIIKE